MGTSNMYWFDVPRRTLASGNRRKAVRKISVCVHDPDVVHWIAISVIWGSFNVPAATNPAWAISGTSWYLMGPRSRIWFQVNTVTCPKQAWAFGIYIMPKLLVYINIFTYYIIIICYMYCMNVYVYMLYYCGLQASHAWKAEVARLVERGLVTEWRPGGDWQTHILPLWHICSSLIEMR